MNIQAVDISNIKPYKNNPRKNANAVDAVANSIKEFGFRQPIVLDGNNEIVAGHTRYFAAKKLGLIKVPCVIAADLTEQQIKMYRLADNKTHELSEWDFDLLGIEINDITDFNVSEFGFDFESDIISGEIQEDDFNIDENIPNEPVSKIGDIYQLGKHRLMCGDSTNKNHVDMLMNNDRFDTMFTDPPYKMQMGGQGCFKESTKNLKSRINDIINFNPYTISFFSELNCGSFYICTSKDGIRDYLDIFKKFNFNVLTWCKTNPTPFVSGTFLPDIEYILYFSSKDKIWNNGLKPIDIYKKYYISSKEYSRKEHGDLHPTMKPLELIGNKLKISSNENGKVLDLFGGSGSTLIACERLNRVCYMMELDPQYCDVIIKRWEQFTGNKATKIV